MKARILIIAAAALCAACAQGRYEHSALQAIPFRDCRVDDPFWNALMDTVQRNTLPSLFDIAEKQGKLDNFRIVAGRKEGKLRLYNAPDSDVYKLLEAAGYSLWWGHDDSLEALCDSIIDVIVAAQAPDGYLHTQYMLPPDDPRSPSPDSRNVRVYGYGPENRWQSRKDNWPYAYSQLYCAGHMMEAGVAYYYGTGKKALLRAAERFADLICEVFTEEKIRGYADHPEVEIGLMRLYELTGRRRYLECADRMARYINFSRPVDIGKKENSRPLAEQSEAYGHCVRTAYIYSGATDVVRATGAEDLRSALMRLHGSLTGGKMYIHGGTGNGTNAEQHGHMYDLPIGPTYSECCASIAQGQWNHALNLLAGDASYAALVELEMFNSALSGMSLDGRKFFYSNLLNIGADGRSGRHSGVRESYLFCCPSKLPIFVSGIGRWIYARDGNSLYVNQYVGSRLDTKVGGRKAALTMESDYMYGGRVSLAFDAPSRVCLRLRVPSWLSEDGRIEGSPYYCSGGEGDFKLEINGSAADFRVENGYIVLDGKWKKGDLVTLSFEMNVRRVRTDDCIAANRGRVALARGPLLYCMEGVDNPGFEVLDVVLPPEAPVSASYDSALLGSGAEVLEGEGVCNGRPVRFRAVPYFLWQNRELGSLCTLIVEDAETAVPDGCARAGEFNTLG